MLLKFFFALVQITELDFEIGIAALSSEASDKSDESPSLDSVDYFEFEPIWFGTILQGRRWIGKFPLS